MLQASTLGVKRVLRALPWHSSTRPGHDTTRRRRLHGGNPRLNDEPPTRGRKTEEGGIEAHHGVAGVELDAKAGTNPTGPTSGTATATAAPRVARHLEPRRQPAGDKGARSHAEARRRPHAHEFEGRAANFTGDGRSSRGTGELPDERTGGGGANLGGKRNPRPPGGLS